MGQRDGAPWNPKRGRRRRVRTPFRKRCCVTASSCIASPPGVCYHRRVPAIVELANVTRRFGEVPALDDVSLAIERGEFFSLLGPSGCGKTTLLRILAGLDFPDSGRVRLGGRDADELAAHRRPVNTVFQSYALFPHLNVRNNVAFGLRMKKIPREQIESRVAKVMELTRITELAARKPAEISGGQKQRVALARAIVNEPEVLLLDEPLGALDLKLRRQLQQELRALQRRTGITFIYVTHDQDEALSMSDRIAVMNHGRVVQVGPPSGLYERPRTRFVAEFLGGCNLLAARARPGNGSGAVVATPLGDLRLAAADARNALTLAIRPEKIAVGESNENKFTGEVAEVVYAGAETQLVVRLGKETLRVVTMNSAGAPPIRAGDRIPVSLPPEALIALED